MNPITADIKTRNNGQMASITRPETVTLRNPVQGQTEEAHVEGDVSAITTAELYQLLRDGGRIQLVNVLDPEKYMLGFIKGSKKIPSKEIAIRAGELDKLKLVVTYCAGRQCKIAWEAALLLATRGFKVKVYEGGLSEWKEAGRPMNVVPGPGRENFGRRVPFK